MSYNMYLRKSVGCRIWKPERVRQSISCLMTNVSFVAFLLLYKSVHFTQHDIVFSYHKMNVYSIVLFIHFSLNVEKEEEKKRITFIILYFTKIQHFSHQQNQRKKRTKTKKYLLFFFPSYYTFYFFSSLSLCVDVCWTIRKARAKNFLFFSSSSAVLHHESSHLATTKRVQ